MGLPNEYIPVRAIVLRCPADCVRKQALAFVPSVVDAFYSQIFHATRDADAPSSGVTIDLEDPNKLKAGVDEYVVRPIDIDGGVDFLPIDLANESRHNVHRSEVLEPLLEYYKAA